MRWVITVAGVLGIAGFLWVALTMAPTGPGVATFWAVMGGIIVLLVCGVMTQWAPPPVASVAWRIVGAMVFLAYAGYVVAELVSPTPNQRQGPGAATLTNAIMGFCVFGIPSLLMMIKGPPRRMLYPSWRKDLRDKEEAAEWTASGSDSGRLAQFRDDAFKRPKR